MKERPILFNGPMVRAILEGRKTQTRRAVKPQPEIYTTADGRATWRHGKRVGTGPNAEAWTCHAIDRCPYGQPGDRLWVRETWAEICHAGDAECYCEDEESRREHHRFEYRADTENKRPGDWPDPSETEFQDAPGWRPSIHMPRKASRITLEITEVRVQRLQEISEEDARAEGVDVFRVRLGDLDPILVPGCRGADSPKEGFQNLWDSLAKPGADSAANPFVWVIEFRRVTS